MLFTPGLAALVGLTLGIGLGAGIDDQAYTEDDIETAFADGADSVEPEVVTETVEVEVEVEVTPPECLKLIEANLAILEAGAQVMDLQSKAIGLGADGIPATENYWSAPYGSAAEADALYWLDDLMYQLMSIDSQIVVQNDIMEGISRDHDVGALTAGCVGE